MSHGVFALNDYLRVSEGAAQGSDARFTVADLPVLVLDPIEHASSPFAINDSLLVSPDTAEEQDAVFALADTPLDFLPPIIKSSQPFAVNDYLLIDSAIATGRADAVHTMGDYLLISPPTPLDPHPQDAVFGIADYNIITDPSPEKLKVWDRDLQRWVHAPRYIWHDDPGEWRQLS